MQSNPNNGGLLFLLLGVLVFSIVRSRRPWRTIVYSVLALPAVVSMAALLAVVFRLSNTEALGAAAFDIFLLAAMGVSLVQEDSVVNRLRALSIPDAVWRQAVRGKKMTQSFDFPRPMLNSRVPPGARLG
jgi:hypothetical protein